MLQTLSSTARMYHSTRAPTMPCLMLACPAPSTSALSAAPRRASGAAAAASASALPVPARVAGRAFRSEHRTCLGGTARRRRAAATAQAIGVGGELWVASGAGGQEAGTMKHAEEHPSSPREEAGPEPEAGAYTRPLFSST